MSEILMGIGLCWALSGIVAFMHYVSLWYERGYGQFLDQRPHRMRQILLWSPVFGVLNWFALSSLTKALEKDHTA